VNKRQGHVLLAMLLIPLVVSSAPRGAAFNLRRADIESFVEEVASRDSLDRNAVLAILKKARRQPAIIEAMNRPAEQVSPWWEYRERLVTDERISRGVKFWADHRQTLEHVAKERGVDPEYVVAIIGLETLYGRGTGKYRVLDALTTLAFDYPPRSEYFRAELEQFLLLTRENRINPLKATGSYAGAMGVPQFMPSAYRQYAVDEDGDHRRDLWGDWDDILGSVANFLKEHGWVAGGPVLADTEIGADATFTPPTGKVELNDTVEGLASHGVKLKMDVAGDTPAVLVLAEKPEGPAYRVGFKNFYVITRYNRSSRYAMAVHDLAQAIAQGTHAGSQP
jgi:membrane-bound lytic murein transglycosylase B